MPKYLCDLHTHTNRSDGSDTPKEVLDQAAALGMHALAITDHDVRPPERIAADSGGKGIVEYAQSKKLVLLRGIEISCETLIEDTHIVGFGCDWHAPYFDELEASVVASKVESYRKLVDELNRNGIAVAWEEVLDNNGSPVPEHAVQKKMLFECIARKGFAESWSAAKQMIKTTPKYQFNREKPTAASAIHAIHATGGIAILAHPYLVSEQVDYKGGTISRDEFIRALIAEGLDGIEANYTYDKTSYCGGMTKEAIAREVIDRYAPLVGVVSGGSDYHADHKKGVANARQIGEAGITPDAFAANPLLRRVVNT